MYLYQRLKKGYVLKTKNALICDFKIESLKTAGGKINGPNRTTESETQEIIYWRLENSFHMVLSQNEKCSSLPYSSNSCCRFVANVIKYTNALKCHDLTAKDVGKVYSPINKPYSTPLACVVCRRLMTALIMHSCLNF